MSINKFYNDVWAATTAAPGSYCGWVVVKLMHFCFQNGCALDAIALFKSRAFYRSARS